MTHALLRTASVLAVTALAIGCGKPAPGPEKPRPVRTVKIALSDGSETLEQTGEIQPRRETDLGFSIDGRIARRIVEVGAVVTKGQLLARLDEGLVQNELRAAEADLASATSALDLAQASLARQEKLFSGQSASAQQIDEARANVRAASARRDVAVAASLNAKKKLGYTNLLAPESGVVIAVGANQGQVVSAGQMVARLATSERDAVFAIAERVVASAPPDVKARVRLVSNPTIEVTGSVREVSPTADPVTHTYRVRIALPDAPDAMGFGAAVTGTVKFPTGAQVTLPASALTSDASSPAVYLVDPVTKRLRRRVIVVSRFGADQIHVASGLAAGDVVVTAGVSKLRPEQVVALADDGGAP
jgi:RND family efflux transporter MFP subunit